MITSATNNKVKRLVTLRDKSKARRGEGVFIVEGVKMFREAPETWIREVYVSDGFWSKCDVELMGRINRMNHEVLSDDVFRKISDTRTPQGILSVLEMPHYELDDFIDAKGGNAQFFVVLEDIQDPGNLGTIMRAGEGAGITGVIMTQNTADIFNPKVIRSTMGSIYRVPFFTVDDIGEAIGKLKDNGISVYAAHLEGSVNYDEADYTKPTAFLIGNEGNGLRRESADMATGYIRIPMYGQVESLNAAVATSILMYEAQRQRRTK